MRVNKQFIARLRDERRGLPTVAAQLLHRLMFDQFLQANGLPSSSRLANRLFPSKHEHIIPPDARRRLNAFFAAYRWHLDLRGPRTAQDLTPDVLAAALETAVERKSLGAYYTAADIAAYIASRTILPWLLTAVVQRCPEWFRRGAGAWRLLQAEPDRYIPQAMRHGLEETLLDGAQHDDWNRPVPFGLPLETRREFRDRRNHCQEIRARLRQGRVQSVTDLVVGNLDLERFTTDMIATAAEPSVIAAFWQSIQELTILDPTCGAGDFLLAAVTILEPIIDACLQRMTMFADEFPFRGVLQELEQAPNRRYFIVAMLLRNHLFGVDVLDSAVEVCRMRLVLRLFAVRETTSPDEPCVPDLTRTIRTGNALTGSPIAEPGGRGFHWQREFPEPMAQGGFSVVLGNPPYVQEHAVADDQLPSDGYCCAATRNLYAYCMERGTHLLRPGGWFGMIVPAGVLGLDEAAPLRQVLLDRFGASFCSSYAIRPAKLFAGVDQRLCIYLGQADATEPRRLFTTRFQHFHGRERPALFACLQYHEVERHPRLGRIPQVGSTAAAGILAKLETKQEQTINRFIVSRDPQYRLYYHRSPRYWIRAMDFLPRFDNGSRTRSIHHFRELAFRDGRIGPIVGALLNSSLFFFWFMCLGNGRNLTMADIAEFPLGEPSSAMKKELPGLFARLMRNYRKHSLVRVRSDCTFQEFRPAQAKPLLDAIDGVLAGHYGFSHEELDFIVNYDWKYRMGRCATKEFARK